MMRYLQYDFLKEKGSNHFDSWVSTFGEQKTEYELDPAGNSYRPRTRIANYCNLPELISMFKQCADDVKKAHNEKMIKNLQVDIDVCKNLPIDTETNLPAFKITIQGNVFTDKTEAAKALKTACMNVLKDGNARVIGNIHGFPISIDYLHSQKCLSATLQGTALHKVYLSDSFPHNLRKIENLVLTMGNRLEGYKNDLNELEINACDARKILSEPFKFSDELSAKSKRLSLLRDELNREAAHAAANSKGERTYYFERAKLKRNMGAQSKSTSRKVTKKAKSICI